MPDARPVEEFGGESVLVGRPEIAHEPLQAVEVRPVVRVAARYLISLRKEHKDEVLRHPLVVVHHLHNDATAVRVVVLHVAPRVRIQVLCGDVDRGPSGERRDGQERNKARRRNGAKNEV